MVLIKLRGRGRVLIWEWERKEVSREQRGGEGRQINSWKPFRTANWNQSVAIVFIICQSKKSAWQGGNSYF